MVKITKVPDGPLIKKKGPFKGSTLKAGGTIKKAQNGIKGNLKGYNPGTSPLPNTVSKGGYEKKLDTIGKGSTRSVRLIDGKGKVLSQERLGSSAEKAQAKTYNRQKTYTKERREGNTDFLESRVKTSKTKNKFTK